MPTSSPRRILLAPFVAAIALLSGSPARSLAAQPPAQPDASRLTPGVTFRLFQLDGEFKLIPRLAENQTPNVDRVEPKIDFDQAAFEPLAAPFVTHVLGYLNVEKEGEYVFRLTSDDGSRLTLDGETRLEHDGQHGATSKASGNIRLKPGRHPFLVEHFDHAGKRRLLLEWKTPGAADFSAIPVGALSTEIDNARVVAPGVKAIRDGRRPGDGVPIIAVHPSFKLDKIEVEGFKPMVGSMTFDKAGRLIVGTFDPLQRDDVALPDIESKKPDKLYALSGVMGDPKGVTIKVCADGLFEPLGLCSVGDAIYVSHRRAITRLLDKDGDGFFETHEDVAKGWAAWNYHQFTFGLVHKDNHLYATLSTAMAPPKWEGMGTNAAPNDVLRGSVLEVDLSSDTFRVIAAGLRAPNGIGWGPEGSLFYCDNQGTWLPSNHLGEVVPGRFFGHFNNTRFVPNLAERFPKGGIASIWDDHLRARPALDLVYNDLCNSPTQPVLVESGPYQGQMFIGELTAGGIRRAALERVGGQWQGAVFQFSQGFDVGINRVAWAPKGAGPEGTLFVGGIGAGGNWNWKNTRSGLERLTPTAIVPFEMMSIHALPDGFEIEFTQEVDRTWLADASHYDLRQWTYKPTIEYGGPKVDVEKLRVVSATQVIAGASGGGSGGAAPAAAGARWVRLKVDGLKPARTVSLRCDPVSLKGEQIWSTTAYYTLNQIPRAPLPATSSVVDTKPELFGCGLAATGVGVPPPARSAVLIGRSARAQFSTPGENAKAVETGRSQDDLMYAEYTDVGAGDHLSRTAMGDCRLHVEWFCPKGGEGQLAANSGVYLQDRYELQILGTPGPDPAHPGAPASNEAGAIYNVKPADVNASTGPGTWQAYDLFFKAPRFEGQGKDAKKTAPALLTAFWNGRLIHNNIPIPEPTGAAKSKGESPAPGESIQIAPLRLQAHETKAEGPVRFRNLWIAPLDAQDTPGLPTTPASGAWTTLAPGNIDAFVPRGGSAKYTFEDGDIVGRSVPHSRNSFLMTKDEFADFELLVDVKQSAELNSGIQIRSTIDAADGGMDNRTGVVRGYQVELDPSPRAYSAGIYEEGRRGWLIPLVDNPAARAAFKPGDWNQIHVIAKGPIIETFINGVPAATMFDAMKSTGHIGLQVHDVGERADPLEVRFRNLRIRKLN